MKINEMAASVFMHMLSPKSPFPGAVAMMDRSPILSPSRKGLRSEAKAPESEDAAEVAPKELESHSASFGETTLPSSDRPVDLLLADYPDNAGGRPWLSL